MDGSISGLALLILLSGMLWISAVGKVTRPNTSVAAARKLGLSEPIARASVFATVAVECALAFGMPLYPHERAFLVLCAAMFSVFALAGLIALARRQQIDCGCLGVIGRGKFGARQVVQLALLAPTLVVIDRTVPRHWRFSDGLTTLNVALLSAALVFSLAAASRLRKARRDRMSLGSLIPLVAELNAEMSRARRAGGV